MGHRGGVALVLVLLCGQALGQWGRQRSAEQDHYAVLGVARKATTDEIRAAYKSLAKKYHPDRPNGDQDKFVAVNLAHEVLSDDQKRRDYDLGFSDRGGGGGGRGRRPPFHHHHFYQPQQPNLFDLFGGPATLMLLLLGVLALIRMLQPNEEPAGGGGDPDPNPAEAAGAAPAAGGREGKAPPPAASVACRNAARAHAPSLLELTEGLCGTLGGKLLVVFALPRLRNMTPAMWMELQKVARSHRRDPWRFAWVQASDPDAEPFHKLWGAVLPTFATVSPTTLSAVLVRGGTRVNVCPRDITIHKWLETLLEGRLVWKTVGTMLPGF